MAAPARKKGSQRDALLRLVREELPRALRQDPSLRRELTGLLAESFTTRAETAAILKEIRDLRADMDRRFEAMDRRFEAMQADMDRRFEAMQQALIGLGGRIEDLKHWVDAQVGGFGRRAGRALEDTIAGTLRYALGLRDIRPGHLRLRQKVEDRDGMIGPRERTYEYDLLLANGDAVVFEVKSFPDVEDVQRFADKADLAARALGGRAVSRVLVTLDKPPEVLAACAARDVRLV
jgi:hypothetical protein